MLTEKPMATTEPRPTRTENGANGNGAAGATQKRYRTLAVVKQEAVTRVEKQLEDSVFVWPHLLVREFLAAVIMTMVLTLTSIAINAPLRDHANPNLTPNPAKAPWYFLGLQEILHYFPPTVAGVLIPGFVLVGLAILPYVDRNPSRAFEDRKLSIALFTIFAVFFAVVTLAGSFFRGSGWQWIWPWQGIFFDL
jgi:quinol---cytochrome c reductase cytochrome c subunit, bacillus type